MMVLMLLFMFQGVWNVAAAFCAHESVINVTTQHATHFGHHQSQSCDLASDTQQQKTKVFADKPVVADRLLSFLEDHHDHLPSFSHFIMVDDYKETEQTFFNHYIQNKLFDWDCFYQSPHLGSLNPPPELIPLFAG